MGFILKEISVRYRHPLTYPDTVSDLCRDGIRGTV
jgi:hypothetical protein